MPTYTDFDKNQLGVRNAFVYFKPYDSTEDLELVALIDNPTYQTTTETGSIETHDFGTIQEQTSDETATVSFSLFKIYDLQLISKLSGGMFEYSQINDSPTSPADDMVVEQGKWAFDQPIALKIDGVQLNNQEVKPTLTSVSGSVSGALAEGDEYFWAWLAGTGWALVLRENMTLDTEEQDITVVVNEYTPVKSVKISKGGQDVVEPITIVFETENAINEKVRYTFYKVNPSGDFGHGFSAVNDAEAITSELTFTAVRDATRPRGDRLMSIEKAEDFE